MPRPLYRVELFNRSLSTTYTKRKQTTVVNAGSLSLFISFLIEAAYREASKGGTITVHQSRLMLVGHSGAGKTSLRHCLLNKPFVDHHITTLGIDADPAEAKVDVCKAKGWCQHDSKLLI